MIWLSFMVPACLLGCHSTRTADGLLSTYGVSREPALNDVAVISNADCRLASCGFSAYASRYESRRDARADLRRVHVLLARRRAGWNRVPARQVPQTQIRPSCP